MRSLDDVIASAESAVARASVPLIEPHPAQAQVLAERGRFNVLACGRRWGKTRLGVRRLSEVAVAGGVAGWFAPTYKYMWEVWEEVAAALAPLVTSANKSDKVMTLQGGGRLDFWTLEDDNAGRGRHYDLVVIDEAAMVRGLSSIWSGSIRPTLIDKGGEAWFLSTPNGPTGFFADAFHGATRGGAEWQGWTSWQMPTATNPYIDAAEIEAARQSTLPTWFRQEYLAEFVAPAGAVFDCLDARLETSETGLTNVYGGPAVRPGFGRILAGVDFGSANTAAVVASEGGDGRLYVYASYKAQGDDATKHVDRLRQKAGGPIALAVGGAPSETAWRDAWGRAGLRVRRPPVSDFDYEISLMYRVVRDRKVVVHEALGELLREMASYSWAVDGEGGLLDRPVDKSKYHRLDALRYLLVAHFGGSAVTVASRAAGKQARHGRQGQLHRVV